MFGRATYQGMAAYWRTASGEIGEIADLMNSIAKVVFSRTLEAADWNNTTLLREADRAAVLELKAGGDGDMYVFGSATLSASLTQADLFDEYRLLVAPVVLGAGAPLFGRDLPRRRMQLLEARPLESGGVLLRYAPAPTTADGVTPCSACSSSVTTTPSAERDRWSRRSRIGTWRWIAAASAWTAGRCGLRPTR